MIVATYLSKGGVGKTTIAASLAAGLARAGMVTLLVDSDGQGNATQYVGLEPYDGFHDTITHANHAIEHIAAVPLAFHGQGDLYVLGASTRQRALESDPSTPQRVYEIMQTWPRYFEAIVVDTSPGRTQVHVGILFGADYVLMPTTCDYLARESLGRTLEDYRDGARLGAERGLPVASVLGIVPNRFKAEDVQQANYTYLHEVYGETYRVFGMMRDLTVWRQSAEFNQSIYAYADEPSASYYARRKARAAAEELQPVVDAVLALARTEGAAHA
jgi:cellulose biosynthesis protein BcsQ